MTPKNKKPGLKNVWKKGGKGKRFVFLKIKQFKSVAPWVELSVAGRNLSVFENQFQKRFIAGRNFPRENKNKKKKKTNLLALFYKYSSKFFPPEKKKN